MLMIPIFVTVSIPRSSHARFSESLSESKLQKP